MTTASPSPLFDILSIEKILGYHFQQPALLEEAFTHRSFANEVGFPAPHNERLEFLGDAVLGLFLTEELFRRYPAHSEGELSRLRSILVDAASCTEYSKQLGVQSFLRLGRGEQQASRGRETILSDLFEAIIGAIYLDGGLEAAKKFFFSHFSRNVEALIRNPPQNWKAQLQDYCQRVHHLTPTYDVLDETGPDHAKTFTITVLIGEQAVGQGKGSSKKEAQQQAAQQAMEYLLRKGKRE